MPESTSWRQAPVLVTGSRGFVGSALVSRLRDEGLNVHGCDIAAGKSANEDERYSCVDITRDLADQLPELEGATVIHTAALMNAADELLWRVNLQGMLNVLEWARANKTRQVIFFSSGGVYPYARGHRHHEDGPVEPIGVYGQTKMLGENLAQTYAALYGMATTSLRLFFPYGPGQQAGIFALIRRNLETGQPMQINVDGAPCINPVHVEDIVSAVQLLAAAPEPYRCLNLCGDDSLSFLDAVRAFETHTGRRGRLRETGEVIGDLLGDNTRLRELGWKPLHRLADLARDCGA